MEPVASDGPPDSTDRLIRRLCDAWSQVHDSHSSEEIYQRKPHLEEFLEGYYRLSDEDRLQLDHVNRYENISSALSRQLLLLIYEICDPTVKRYVRRADSAATVGSSTNSSTIAETPQSDSDELQCATKLDRTVDEVTLPLDTESSESRCQWLKDFFLHGIGGLFLQTLSKIGAKDIANGREITAVLVRILPTTKWNNMEHGLPVTSLEPQKGYGEFVRGVLKMRTFNGDWRECMKRSGGESTIGQTVTLIRQLSGPKVVADTIDFIQAAQFSGAGGQQQPDRISESQFYDTRLSQDQFTLTVLNLLESLIVHENVLTIDENSVTVSCLRAALEQLKRHEVIEESTENRLVIRHKLLGLVMLCLNNMFFLETLDSNDINLRIVATELLELLKSELRERPSDAISCEFMYNLIYTIVSAVNQTFLHFCDNLVSEQLFMAIFKLLENNLDIIKHTYSLLQLRRPPLASGGNLWIQLAPSSSNSGLVEILIKMLQNFIYALAPSRIGSYKRTRRCSRLRLHHSRQGARSGYVCALENLLLNLFPLVKHSDQRALATFFKSYQLCCCNTNVQTLEVLMKLSNDELIPKLRLHFASRAVVYAIFNRSQCETCESDRAANTFYEQFTRTHREVFREFRRVENRTRMPTFLRYLLDIVRAVPYRLRSFLLQELVLELLTGELKRFAAGRESTEPGADEPLPSMDESGKEIINGCLVIVCRAVAEDERMIKLFYRDEMIHLLQVLSGRLEFVHCMHQIMTIGIHSQALEGKLEEILFTNIDNLVQYAGQLFEAITTCKLGLSLKSFTSTLNTRVEAPLETTLQLHLEHWKTLRHLLKENDRFRKRFFRHYGGVKGVQRFMDLAYNLVSVCVFPGATAARYDLPSSAPEAPAFKIPDHGESVSVEPERRSVLNIFHFNDQLIDGTVSGASFYYSATDETITISAGPKEVVGTPEEDEDYSFLRELRLATITGQWEVEYNAFVNGTPPYQRTSIGRRGRELFSKLEKKWSLSELFNIRQMLSELMDGYLPGSKDGVPKGLPKDARSLLLLDQRGGATVVRKKLTSLLELILGSMQLLINGDVTTIDDATVGSQSELGDTMQIALLELKKLLMSNALSHWECPNTANDVMNVLQALLKVAEMRTEMIPPPPADDSISQKEVFPTRSSSCEEDDRLSDPPRSYHDEQVQDDASSTDESYTTAREDGYEGDVEIEPYSPQELLAKKEAKAGRGKPCDSDRSLAVSVQICNIVTELLVELSARCVERPDHWCQALAQMIVKLNMIRTHLGGSLYLIRGFALVLRTNDSRLKELQASIMDLIVDLDNPQVLVKYVQLLGEKDPPVQLILTKLTNLFETTSSGLECYQSIHYPVVHANRTFSTTSDVLLAKKITFLREHHLFFNVRSGFTDAATVVPLNYANFYPWHGNGFTVALWMRVEQLADHSSQPELTHLLSVGSEKQLLSVCFNSQRQLVVRYSKPDRVITPSNTKRYLGVAGARSECCENCAKEMQHLWTYKHLLRSITDGTPQPFVLDTAGAQCVYCFKQLPVGGPPTRKGSQGKALLDDAEGHYETSVLDVGNLRQCTIGQDWCVPEGTWTLFTLAVQQTADETIAVTMTLDGVQRLANLLLPNACRIHIDTDLTVLTVGHRASTPTECSVGYDLAGVHLFSKCITDEATLANLYAIGPNSSNFAAFANGSMIPNYGTLNLGKLVVDDLRTVASLQLLERTHLGYLSACKADTFVGRNAQTIGLMSFGGKLRATEHNSLQRSLLVAGGVSVMLVCFARVVEISDSPALHAAALKLLLRIAHCNHDFFNEFVQCNYLELIGIVLKSKKCHKDIALLATLLETAFDQPILAKRTDQYRILPGSVARVRYPGMITFLLENFHIWIDQSEEVLDLLLSTLATVTRDKHPGMMYNCQRLQGAGLVPALIDFCRVNFVIPAKTVKISRNAADLLVSLIAILSPTPPKVSLLNEIMELLLLMHKPTDSYVTHDRQKFYFNISSQNGASSSSSGGKRGDKTSTTAQSATGAGNINLPGTPKMQLRDRRQLRPTSQLRKILPLTISAGSSFESATTSFIIDASQSTPASTNTNTSGSATITSSGHTAPPKSPKLASPGTEGNTEECYEKLNKALADGKRLRKSLMEGIDRGSAKLKLRRLNSSPNMRPSPNGRRKFGSGSPRFVSNSPKLLSQCTRNDLNRGGTDHHHQSAPASSTLRYKFFEQNYFATGNDFLQESFLRVMCDFLLILPDSDARKFLSGENRILETLLILANNGNIRIRTMLLNLVAVIDDRIDGGGAGGDAGGTNAILQQYSEEQSKVFWYHLANQIGTHSVNGELIASCYRWITKSNVNPLLSVQGGSGGEESPLSALLQQQGTIEVIRENGLNVLIAILIQAHIDPPLFHCVLQLIEYICIRHPKRAGQYMIDNGLVWALAKTVVKMNEKEERIREESRTYLLDFLTSFSHLVILSPVANPFWDLLNGLTVAQKHKSERVTQAVRDLHAALVRNVLQIFIFRPKQSIIGNKNTSFTVELVGSNLSKSEVKTRFNRLHDKAVQFVTNSDPEGELSDAEWALIRHLMNRTLNGNPRGGNIILWCLLPKRPIRLKLYTIRQLGQYLEGGGNHLSAICDVKMLKVFVQSILLLNQKHIPLEELRVVNAFYQSIDGGLSHGASWNLTQTLKDFEYLRTISMNDQEQMILKSIARQEKLIYSCTVAAMQVTRNSVEKQNRLRKELIIQLRKDNDYRFYDQWQQLVGRLTHEDAPWYNGAAYPASWELDDTYGPDMALKRMRRCPLTIDRRFLLKETQPEKGNEDGGERMALLAYLFPGDYHRAEYSVEEQVLYTFTVRKITPSRELECECIITSTELVLKPYDVGALELYDLHDITKIWTKRYEHQESAVEVFLKSGKSLFIVFDRDPSERATFEGFFHDLVARYGRGELDYHTQLWREGALSNWEYLMLLNQVSGRTFHDLMQYPVFPWVLASYDSPTLDLLAERTFRLLEKPIAVQHRELEKHYINNYNHLRQAEESGDPSGAGGRRKIQPYHYSSHYSNSGTVLHFLVRVLPFTSLFLQYQDDSFDIPDRTFHSLQTTWNLASKDSPTDVKELIPEFFSFPEFLENQEGFDFGTRQSGEPVNHVELPPWCNGSARLFVLIHRQALEAGIVRRQIAQWIDLIFGFKQTGQAAIDAINVFHPATYCDFSAADIDDPVMKLALETMVKTYGQMPRQLFDLAHPPPIVCPLGANPPTVLENVIGLRWGLYCGSPVLANPKLVNVWERPSKDGPRMPTTLVALEADRMYAMPDQMNVFQGGPKKYYTVSWGEADDRLRIRPLQDSGVSGAPESTRELWYGSNGYACDPITACGTDPNCTSIFFGHRSGRIAVFQRRTRRRRVSFFNQHMQPSVTMMARSRSTSFRRWIDRKSANLRRKLELDPDDQQQNQQQQSQQSQHQQHQDQPDGDQMDWNYPIYLLKHRAPIGAIRISMEYKIVVSVSIDGCAAIWDVNSLTYVREIPQPVNMLHSMITQVAISPTLGDIVLVHSNANVSTGRTDASGPDSWSSATLVEEDDSFEVTENYNVDYVNITMATTTTNRRDQLRLYTINAQYVEHVFLESPIRAVTYSTVKEGCGVNCIVVALESGIMRFYSSWNLALLREVNVEPNGIRCVLFSKNQHLLLLTGNGTVQTWSAEGLPGPLPSIQEPYQPGG
ncbi:lysosomal-trafficking regulator [Anopheles ziemanni]|uniref:lysosomal-trafficking regulator n=1 Tax=Anopheles coustani TaxID=139045 RepID=UPI00265AA801|nr:lysosomal-trafficking regulator [Anopheles coustani]XP_058169851.1 lysosomal-trafficking regulator [Anopheles ziemanni]